MSSFTNNKYIDINSDSNSYRIKPTVFNSNANSNADNNTDNNTDSSINYNTNSIIKSNNTYKVST